MVETSNRVVVALGGNAILTDDPSSAAQEKSLRKTAKLLKQLAEENQLIITHGNGPQVGNLMLQQLAGSTTENPAMPLDTVGAMTQGEIGYWLSNAITNELQCPVGTIVTRTLVDPRDPGFVNPSKPIGPFYDEDQYKEMQKIHGDWKFIEDSGRGYRRVVPSPKPVSIIERDSIVRLVDAGSTVIAAGGGGVPVVRTHNGFVGVEAVVDKDLTTAKLAELVFADQLFILTNVK
ncbi:MAG: carbamate kinase, partial [Lactobacillaceae bacterium]|nr:carbamate kinase [Lactobacillaceae bacterium]